MESTAELVRHTPFPANFSMEDMILVNTIMQEVERDCNLSMLPDDFKQMAIETMFEEYKEKERQRLEGMDICNKRQRTSNDEDGDSIVITMEE